MLSDPDHWIPFELFNRLVKDKAITNWEEACGREVMRCVLSDNASGMAGVEIKVGGTSAEHYHTSSAPSALSLCNIVTHLLVASLLLS